MKTPLNQNAKWRARIAFFFLFVSMVVLSIGAYFVAKLQESLAAHESQAAQTALQDVTDRKQLDEALRRHPSNKLLKMIAMVTKAANETEAATETLSNEVEPPALSKSINFGTASRSELEALRHDLKTAEANATTCIPRYIALITTERDKVETYALSLGAKKDIVSTVLNGVDRQHAKTTTVTSETLSARADYYRAYESYVAVLVGEFGAYKVVDGQFIFPLQRTLDRYNVAAHAMTVAAKRVAELEEERKKLVQSQQVEWEQLVSTIDDMRR
jgi:hypothetical protein